MAEVFLPCHIALEQRRAVKGTAVDSAAHTHTHTQWVGGKQVKRRAVKVTLLHSLILCCLLIQCSEDQNFSSDGEASSLHYPILELPIKAGWVVNMHSLSSRVAIIIMLL